MKTIQWPVRMNEDGIELIVYIKVQVPMWAVRKYGQIEAIKMYLNVR
jgi:hypothetical protein